MLNCRPMARSKVAVLRTKPETILDDIDRLHRLAGAEQALQKGARTILATDLSWQFPFPAANTTPWQLEGTIRSLRDRGYDDLVCDANQTHNLDGYRAILERYAVPVCSRSTAAAYRAKATLHVLDAIPIPDAFRGANLVQLPTVKCDVATTTSGAMKTALARLVEHPTARIHETLVDLLAIQQEIHAGLFAVMDGTTAGDGPGPRTMRPVTQNVILASADQVAIDAVAAAMMGFDPMALTYIRMATEQGLGHGTREAIEIVGDVELADQRWGFSVGGSGGSLLGELMRSGPLAKLLTVGAAAYRDHYRWPLHDRKIFEQWKEQTEWGRLFDRYQSMGTLSAA